MKFRIFTIKFWKTIFNSKDFPSEVLEKPTEPKSMSEEPSQNQIIQPTESVSSALKEASQERIQKERLIEPKLAPFNLLYFVP